MSVETLLKDTSGRLLTKCQEMKAMLDKTDEKSGKLAWEAADHDRFKALKVEIEDLGKEKADLAEKARIERETEAEIKNLTTPEHPTSFGAGHDGVAYDRHGRPVDLRGAVQKSLGRLVTESKEFKAIQGDSRGRAIVELKDFDFKTTLATGAGFAPANNRLPDVVPFALRKVVIYDVVPQITVGDLGVVKYMEETTHTANNAAASENSQLAENAYAYTERSRTIQTIGSTLPITEQQMLDVPFIEGIVDQMMGGDQMRAEETEILTGSGSDPHLTGFLSVSGIGTQARGTDSAEVAIYKAMTGVRYTGFAEPTAFIVHPNNWQTIRLHQDSQGRFIWGDPWTPGPEMIWGVPVVVTPAITANTGLVGAFRPYSYVARRLGIVVEVGYSGSDFVNLRRTVRCYSRLCLVVRRPSAFETVTGLS